MSLTVLAFSDTHLGKARWGDFGLRLIDKAVNLIDLHRPDLVLFGGDLVEPDGDTDLDAGLAILADLGPKVLWTLGNNDYEVLLREGCPPLAIPARMDFFVARHPKIQVLDHRPWTGGSSAIVGNYMGYDGSLSQWSEGCLRQGFLPDFPEEIGGGMTPVDLFRACFRQVKEHLAPLAHKGRSVLLCTHTVPHQGMVLYGLTDEYDFLNETMGWDDREEEEEWEEEDEDPERVRYEPLITSPAAKTVVLRACAHTHRGTVVAPRGEPPIINISTNPGEMMAPRIFVLP